MQFYNACVLSTLTYSAECWTLKDSDEKRLDAFDMRCQRKILKIKWSDFIRNKDIRAKTKQPQLSSIIRQRRLTWFRHLQKMDENRLQLATDGCPISLRVWPLTDVYYGVTGLQSKVFHGDPVRGQILMITAELCRLVLCSAEH